MGGRRKGGNGRSRYKLSPGMYSVESVQFWLTDGRIQSLSATTKIFFFYAGLIAIQERSNTLPAWATPRFVGNFAGIEHRTCKTCVARLVQNSLLGQTDDGRIIVYGAMERHGNMKRKDQAIKPVMVDHIACKDELASSDARETRVEDSGKAEPDWTDLVMSKKKPVPEIPLALPPI